MELKMNLKQFRRSRPEDYSQNQVADRIGMTRGRYSQLEIDPEELKVKTIRNLARVFRTSPVTIFKIIIRMQIESEVTK